jgi:hypothetical protein
MRIAVRKIILRTLFVYKASLLTLVNFQPVFPHTTRDNLRQLLTHRKVGVQTDFIQQARAEKICYL